MIEKSTTGSVDFEPARAIRNPHIQSMIARAPWCRRQIEQRAAGLVAHAERIILDCGQGVRLAGFLSRANGRSSGLVVMLHGWEGCADSLYMLSAGAALQASGFDVFRLNFRDHGDTHELNEELFHSCRIDEVVNAVAGIQSLVGTDRMALVGQSLGGNFAIRVALRAPARGINIARVIAVAPVLNPASTMRALEQGIWIYRRFFLSRWRQSLRKKARLFPARYDFGNLRQFGTLTATTDHIVRHHTEYASLDDYLNGYALTGSRLESLAISTRAIFAADDPVIPSADIDSLAKPAALDIQLVRHGGHCGFIKSFGLESWIDNQIVTDLSARMNAG